MGLEQSRRPELMRTLLATTPNCLVYDDGEPLGNRSSTIQTLLLPLELEWAPGRGGIVIRDRRLSVSHVHAFCRHIGYSVGKYCGSFGIDDERTVLVALEFGDQHPEVIEPEDEEAPFWLD